MALYADLDALRASAADVRIVTSDGQSIAAHSYVLATESPVLAAMIDKGRRGWSASAECTIRIPGVASDGVLAFLHFLYASRVVAPGQDEAVLGLHGAALLALAHAHRVGWLKRAAEAAVSARLTPDRAVDMLKLARLCDAPRLRLACARLAGKDFAAVERSDGYRFARRHDPPLELELLRMLEDADQRKARWLRERASREAYRQLGDAMDALDRIFADDATDAASSADKARDGTCQGLRLLMRHFATCARKIAPGGCARCKRMLQLFRLHASVCENRPEQEEQTCRVPLCRARMATQNGPAIVQRQGQALRQPPRIWLARCPFCDHESLLVRGRTDVAFVRFRDSDTNGTAMLLKSLVRFHFSRYLELSDQRIVKRQILMWLVNFSCSHFKSRMQTEKADKTWRLLVKKVTRARAMASFVNRRKVPEIVAMSWARYNSSISNRWANLR